MAKFGEHGLTWLQYVNRGPALTDYKPLELSHVIFSLYGERIAMI